MGSVKLKWIQPHADMDLSCLFTSFINLIKCLFMKAMISRKPGQNACCTFIQLWDKHSWRIHKMWPCITKPTKSRMAQFCVMAWNRWSGSAWVIFRIWYILKEQSFFYIHLKFGSIKRIISRGFCCFYKPIFLWSDGSCDHSTCPIISF